MKKSVLYILISVLSVTMMPQNPPVAINDTVKASFGEIITVNVVYNDYHPDGVNFNVTKVIPGNPLNTFTDSTITFTPEYWTYYNHSNGYYKRCTYEITDENNQTHKADIIVEFFNSQFSDTIDIGNVKAAFFAYGPLFFPGCTYTNNPVKFFEFPKESGRHVNFVSNLWLGGLDGSGQLHLAAEKYRCVGIDYWAGPVSSNNGEIYADSITPYRWHRVWKLSAEQVRYHIDHWKEQGYEPIVNIKTWPAHGDESLYQSNELAPFVDTDGDEKYDPYSGDYPLIRGDQAIFFIFNDLTYHSETKGDTLGIEIHAMAYAFDEPENDALTNTIFLSYKIFNRSSNTYTDTYVGMYSDYDIGNWKDDYLSTDVSRGAIIGYNGDDFDEDYVNNNQDTTFGYGENPPAHAVVFLGGPYMDANATDDPDGGCDESINGIGFADGIVDNERYGLTNSFGFSPPGPAPTLDWAYDYYNYLKSIWKDGNHMKYYFFGWAGDDSTKVDANFIYPGLSDTCFWGTGGIVPDTDPDWKEETAYMGLPNEPGDRRALGSMGPFTFYPNTFQNIDIAFVTAQGDGGSYSSVELVKVYIDSIRSSYKLDSDNFGFKWLGNEERKVEKQNLRIFPNPAKDEIRLDYIAEGQTIEFAIYDAFGRLVNVGQLSNSGELRISINELKIGIYIIKITDQNKMYSAKILKN